MQQKYRSEAVDDYHKGTMFIAKGGIDAVKGVRKHFKLKTQYKLEKQKYKLQRDEKKAYRKNSYKPKMKANTADRKHNKAFYKEQKCSFKKADKKSAGYRYRSQVMKYRRRKYRQSKKEIRLERRGLKTDMKYLRKNAFNQWRIKHLSNPGLLILKPARYTGGRLRASAYQKAVNADDSNDFLKAADFAKNHVVDKVVDKVSKDNRLHHREKRRDRLSDREHRADSRLKKREDKLHNKKETYKKNRKKQSIKRHNKKSFSESVRDIFKLVKNVYEKEVKHFFLVILVPILIMLLVLTFILKYEAVKITLECEGVTFTAKGRSVIATGWKAVEGKTEEEKGIMLPAVSEGDSFTVSAERSEHFTSPPKPYTEDTLLSAMEHAGAEDFDDEAEKKGLGTPATRAGTIENLVSRGYARREGKKIISTDKGRALIAAVPEEIKSVKLTADWENQLALVEHGKMTAEDFMSGINTFITDLCRNYSSVSENASLGKPSVSGKCPNCGCEVRTGKFGFYCVGKCGMQLGKVYGKALTAEQLGRLLDGESVTFTSKGKKTTVLPEAEPFGYEGKDGKRHSGFQWKVRKGKG